MTLRDEVTESINPGDDFYNYVNKKWRDDNPVPVDKSSYNAFTELNETVIDQVHALLKQTKTTNEAPTSRLAKRYFASGMDVAAIENRDLKPIIPLMNEATNIRSKNDIVSLLISRHINGDDLLWSLDLDIDEKDSQKYVMVISQSGLLLPDRDYYIDASEQFDKTRSAYRDFLANVFTALDVNDVATQVENVIAIETQLAQASNTSTENRDSNKLYNPYTASQLTDEFVGFDWGHYFSEAGISPNATLVVHQPKFIKNVLEIISSVPIESWRSYLIAHSAVPHFPLLSKRFADMHFAFFGTVLTGAEEQEDRYVRIIKNLTHALPEPVGRLYVESHFDEAAKAQITDLVGHIKEALGERIKNLDWMSHDTKAKALEKLDTFMPLLGYPDSWRSYDTLKLGDDYFENVRSVNRFEWAYDIKRLTLPVNRREWLMSPATVNAYYWPNTNGITFPAAILQPPFFDAGGDFAANYGSIGDVIGHELTHGFDDSGSKYDKVGNLSSWWTDDDREAFERRAQKLIKQFDDYEVNGQHVKGELTLGENIADLGGTLVAYDALQKKLHESGAREAIDGFTPEQRFFMAQARGWRMNVRPELAMQLLVVDPHAPAELRVNGLVPNIDAWYEAWNIKDGDQLYRPPSDRVRIW